MKKSIKQAVSRGVALLVLLPAAHTAFAGVAGNVEYRVAWNQTDSRYHVYVRPTTTPTPDLSMTGQVTLRVPHATGTSKFTVKDIQPKSGTSWSLSSEVFAPTEDKATDYLSFSFTPIDVRAFAFKAGVEQEAFSFKNAGPCMPLRRASGHNSKPGSSTMTMPATTSCQLLSRLSGCITMAEKISAGQNSCTLAPLIKPISPPCGKRRANQYPAPATAKTGMMMFRRVSNTASRP